LDESPEEMTESQTLPGAATVSGLEALKSYMRGWRRNWSEWEWREEELVDVPPDKVVLVSSLWLRGLRSGATVETAGLPLRPLGYR
jgi:hypothetical protein